MRRGDYGAGREGRERPPGTAAEPCSAVPCRPRRSGACVVDGRPPSRAQATCSPPASRPAPPSGPSSAGPWRPGTPRSSDRLLDRLRQTASGCLLACAALLAVLAAPAAAQDENEVWSATLTVAAQDPNRGLTISGCASGWDEADKCASRLTSTQFTYDEVTITVVGLSLWDYADDLQSRLCLRVSPSSFYTYPDPPFHWQSLTLHVGDSHSFKAIETTYVEPSIFNAICWDTDLEWQDDDTVALSITEGERDLTAPSLESATVAEDGAAIDLLFDEEFSTPTTAQLRTMLTVRADGQNVRYSAELLERTDDYFGRVLRLRLETFSQLGPPSILPGQTVVVSYTDPNPDSNDSNVLSDRGGNDVATFTTGAGGVPAVVNPVPPWSVTVDPATIAEDGGVSTLTVSTGGVVIDRDRTIKLTIGADSTATENTDYTIASKTLTLAANTTSVTTTITAVQDFEDDDNETVTITATASFTIISAPVGETATLTISEIDDVAPRLESATVLADGTQIELVFDEPYDLGGAALLTAAAFGVTVDGSTVTGANLHLVTSGDLAYRALELRTLSPAITANQSVVVTYTDPGTGDDTTAVLQDAAGNDVVTFTTGEGGVPAVVNNVPVPWSVTVDPDAINEFGGVVFSTLTVSTGGVMFPDEQTITLEFGGDARAGDFKIFDADGVERPNVGRATELTLAAGATELEVTIAAQADEVDDPEALTIQAFVGLGSAQTAISEKLTIMIRDVPFPWSVMVDPETIAEDGGVAAVTVSTGGAAGFEMERTITLVVTGTAMENTDYTIASKSLTLAAGETEVSTTITSIGDMVDDDNETVTITATVGGTQIGDPATVTITEVDLIAPRLESATVSEDGTTIELVFDEQYDSTGAAALTATAFSVTLDGSTVTRGELHFVTSGDLAYRALELRTLSPAITANQTVVVTYTDPGTGDDTTAVLQDAAGNDVATFTTGEGGVPAVVNNVPVPWSVTVDPAAINEFGGVVSSTLTVSTGGATFPVDQTIVLELSGTAAGGDFEIFDANGVRILLGGSVTRSLAAGETELSFTITAIADEVDDPDETLVIQAKVGAGTAVDPQVDIGEAVTVTIRNVPFPWSVTVDPETIAEDGGVSTVTVSTGGATLDTARTIALVPGGTATEDDDYTIDSKSLLLAAGGTLATTTIRAEPDTEIEGAETVTIKAMIGTEQIGETVTLTIVEVEPPGAPDLILVLACTGCVDLAWDAPESVGGGPITGYQYQRKEGDGGYGNWTDIEDDAVDDEFVTYYDVDPDTTYTYRVRAVNAGGGGAASNERSATTGPPIEVGADPLEYRVAETAESVTVEVVAKVPEGWDLYNREFQVTVATESRSATSFEDYRPITETLTFVRSEFRNIDGQHTATKDVSIEIVDRPEAEDEESFVVLVEPAPGLASFIQIPDATDTATVTIVDDDHAPVIRQPQLNVVLDRTEVGQLRASDADGDALRWRIVGGADRDQFEVTEDGLLSITMARTSATLANPDDDNMDGFYEVVVEVTDGGNPVTAELSLELVDAEPASTPLRPIVGAGDGEATAYWSAPASDGGAPVDRYEYWVHRGGRDSPLTGRTCPEEYLAQGERACALFLQSGEPEDWTPVPGGAEARQVTVGNLVNGKMYQFKVRAVNAAGPGMYAWQPAEPYGEAAEAPELTVTLADRTVDDTVTTVAVASWTRPANPAGLPLVGYIFEGSRDGVEWANADGGYRSETFYSRFIGSCSETYHSPCNRHPEFNNRRLLVEEHMTHWHFRVQALYSAGTLAVHADAPEEAKNKLRVSSPFSNVARAGDDGALPGTVAEALTVRFEDTPESHSGRPFGFRVAFNQAVAIDEASFAAHALIVGNGAVTAASRVEARPGAWEVTVAPASFAAVSVRLANPACGEPGAVCTADGGALEAAPAELIPGPPAGVVTAFELVDRGPGGETVTLTDGGTVELADPSALRWGIVATVTDDDVKSVELKLRGPGPKEPVTKTENYAPWSLYGDANGKAHGKALPAGRYTLTATAYAEKDLGGAVLGALGIAFTVSAASGPAVVPDTEPAVTGFKLVDRVGNTTVALADGMTVELADPSAPRWAIVAEVDPGAGVKSVTLSLSGTNKTVSPRTENIAPWSLYGDDLVNPYGKTLPAGAYTLTATAWSEKDLGGNDLGTLRIGFTAVGPPALSVADATANEADGRIEFAVTLDRAASGEVTVQYATADGSATAGEDYTAASGTLTFAAGERSKTVSVALLDDAVDDGGETFRLLLSNPTGAVIADGEATGTIENADPMPSAWLVRFGRTVGSQVVDAVTARLEAPGASHLTLGGQRLSLDGEAGDAEGADRLSAHDEQAARETLTALADRFADPADPADGARHRGQAGVRSVDGRTGDGWMRDGAGADARTMTGRELLLGSSFHLAAGGEDGAAAVAAWGRVATGGFDAEVDEVRLDGAVTTAMLGADVASGRWLAGAAVALSQGTGGYALTSEAESAFDKGDVESRLTGVFPYARLALSERVSAWGLLGYGTGTLTLSEENGDTAKRYTTDIGLRMGAVGARGTLLAPEETGGFELAIRTDAMVLRTTSDATGGMAASQADASRLRLILDGSRSFEAGGGTLTPRLELGLRHDGGDAETGTGVEVGAGLSYQANGIAVEGAVRTLIAHEDEDYREWGASGSVRIDPGASGRGLSLTLRPTWGAASSGTERLWGLRDASGLAADGEFEPERRLDAEVGYGFSVLDGRGVATPYAGWSQAGERETLRLGQRLRLGQATEWRLEGELGADARIFRAGYGYRLGSGLTFTTEASRREAANDDAPEHAVMLRASMRW